MVNVESRVPSPKLLVPVEFGPSSLRVIACPRPFSVQRVDKVVLAGSSISCIMRDMGMEPDRIHARVFLDDQLVEQAYWERVKPKPGHTLTIRVVPTGGGGGGGGKDPLRIVLQIVVIAAAVAATYFSAGALAPTLGAAWAWAAGAAIGAAVSIVGNLAVNALVPPPNPNQAASLNGTSDPASQTYSLTGSQNRLLPYGVIPRVLGFHKMFPPLVAKPYTELVGDDQYYRLLFTFGYGPLDLSAFQIGTTPLSNFAGVEYEVRQGYLTDPPLSLFSNTMLEDALSIALTAAGGWQMRTSRAAANELSIDVTFPQGLTKFNNDGTQQAWTVQVDVQYAPAGSGAWASAGSLVMTATKSSQVRRGLRWTVATPGTYDIRLQRVTADSTDSLIRDAVYWTTLRTINSSYPINMPGLALVAMRIKATDQLNGVVDQFNGIAKSILPDWNGSSWVTQITNNVASCFREVLQGRANARALPDSRIDLAELQTWHQECVAAGRTFNGILDTRRTVLQMLQTIAPLGRGAWNLRDGKYSVVRDLAQSTPVQVFTPRNSWGYQGTKAFVDLPDALTVQFINPATDWQQDERRVPRDGYGITGADGVRRDAFGQPTSNPEATLFETLALIPGCTDPQQAWSASRYHQADAQLRPETHTFMTDVENLVCTRGDRIEFNHDVILAGLGSGRVKAVQVDGGGNATGITLDEVIPMEAGKSYGVRIRRADGVQVVQPITTVAGEQTTVTFTSPLAEANSPAVGDLVPFGISGMETVALLVKMIEPGPDLTAKLSCVDYAPAIQTADQGAIPAFSSQITSPTKLMQQFPPFPIIDAVRSDEEVLVRDGAGVLQPRILISFHFASGATVAAVGVQVRYRRTGSTDHWTQLAVPLSSDATEASVAPVEQGVAYDIMLRSVAGTPAPGLTSDWATITNHTVIGKSTPPPDVTTLVLEGRWLRWLYPAPPLDFAGFRVRMIQGTDTAWDTAVPMHDGLLTETRFLAPMQDGVRTYLVKAVDVAGNESQHAAAVSHNFGVLSYQTEFGDPIVKNLILSTDLQAAGFPGTITNGSIISGDLKADSDGTPMWTGDLLPWWTRDSEAMWIGQYKELVYVFTVLPDTDKLDATLSLAATIQAQSSSIDYHPDSQAAWWTNDADPMWTNDADPMWADSPDFLPWPTTLIGLTRQVYTFRITLAAGLLRGILSALLVNFDVPDLNESLENVAIGSSGSKLPTAKHWRVITNVHLTMVDDGGVAQWVKAIRPYDPTGPETKAWDGTFALTTAHVNALLEGY